MSREPIYTYGTKVHVYGSGAALCIEAVSVEDSPQSDRSHTVLLEFAKREANTVYWKDKLTFQVSDSELVQLALLVTGYKSLIEIKRGNKGVEIKRQEGQLYFRATQGSGRLFSLPATLGDAFKISSVVLEQLMKMSGLQDAGLVHLALRGTATLVKS
jgi:hypothetical protein